MITLFCRTHPHEIKCYDDMRFKFYDDYIFPLAVEEKTPSGPAPRDRSHIEETLRLATAEPSREFVCESCQGNIM